MAENDFTPLYANEQSYRPAYDSRTFGAGFRAPGFIGMGTSSAQPQTAPVQGAQTSADATAALRGLYPARADESGMGIGERSGAINAGQQPTREADSLVDLGVSIAKGLGMISGPVGFGRGMYEASQRTGQPGYTAKDLFGDNIVGRALAAAFGPAASPTNSLTGVPRDLTGPGVTGEAPPPTSLTPPSDAPATGETGLAPGTGVAGQDYSPVSDFGRGDATSGGQTDARGAEREVMSGGVYRRGGPIGRPGAPPKPVTIKAHTGEFVQRPEAVNKYGASAMSAINALKADPAGIKRAAKSAPARAKANRKEGSARDALSKIKARR